ncbi:MAG TPA: hypothetical protein VJ850_09715 [Candidatus Limnocylindrales bacterium]|nr:hypothetical protein [Candidatus Limnocylindrales bacterium]
MAWLLAALLAVVTGVATWLLAFGDPDRIGVAGTLLGGVVGLVAGLMLDRERRRHDDSHRFEADRRLAYVKLLALADASEAQSRGRRLDREVRAEIAKRRPDMDLNEVAPIREAPKNREIDALADEIELLAPFGVYASAQLLGIALDGLAYEADRDREPWDDAAKRLRDSRRQFLKAAKRDLATPTGVMTPWQERRYRVRKFVGRVLPKRKPREMPS